LHNEELHYLSLSLNANKMKSSRVRCTGSMQSTGELTNACAVLIALPRPRHVCAGYVWLIRTSGACYSNDTDQPSDYHLLKISCFHVDKSYIVQICLCELHSHHILCLNLTISSTVIPGHKWEDNIKFDF
jgi:hypothetical protein